MMAFPAGLVRNPKIHGLTPITLVGNRRLFDEPAGSKVVLRVIDSIK